MSPRHSSRWLVFVVGLVLFRHSPCCEAVGEVACDRDEDCDILLQKDSTCGEDGFCTNPFHYGGGCLKTYLPDKDWKRIRVCNSDDPPMAAEEGYCRPSPLDYMEIRISSQNWDSAYFQAWILQVILSELLDVPTSIETSVPDLKLDFYNKNSALGYGTSNDLDALRRATEVGDCRSLKLAEGHDPDSYISCSHVIAEVWPHEIDGRAMYESGEIESPLETGALGENNFFLPKFTAQRDPTLVSYLGLQGEANRRKLAETFLRPTKFKDYCEQVSANKCASDDGVATRAPLGQEEEESYFLQGLYIGHFRATEENDCDKNPTTCTGHLADFPCQWGSFAKQQMHHLNIALKSSGPEGAAGGYSYTHLNQIWAAAEATQSNLMMVWWSLEGLYQRYLGTEAEFTRVVLPPPTQTCVDARANTKKRCGDDLELLLGEPEGSCDFSSESLQRIVAGGFYDRTHEADIPPPLSSPSHHVLQDFHVTTLHLGEIFENWLGQRTDQWNLNPRDATCRWVTEHLELIESFLPATYPRVVQEDDISTSSLFKTAVSLACMAILLCLLSIGTTYLRRNQKVTRIARIEFLWLVQIGLLSVSSGALLLALPPSTGTCVAFVWLTSLGYTVELVAVVVRIAAIQKLVSAGKGMQYVHLKRKNLFGTVLGCGLMISTILLVWTIVDSPREQVDYILTEDTTGDGDTIVRAVSFCGSKSDFWMLFTLAWEIVLIVSATLLVFLARRAGEDLNDSRALSLLVYSHFFCALARITLYLVEDTMDKSEVMEIGSFIYSIDCIAALLVYVVPKFFATSVEQDTSEPLPDLFLNTTIMFADVSGFTAWSSMRDPSQVFTFLETVYGAFDKIAEQRKVFKVETVGDCYVAATGIPDARSDHAVVMVKFAYDCLVKMRSLTQELDVIYGPDTHDLALRVGIHSGPVTGGFLKGKGARFQLFGDTMNTTGRIEDSGERNRIHLSEETAHLLVKAGKRKWLEKRIGRVPTKGKGELQTYWLEPSGKRQAQKRRNSLGDSSNADSQSHGGSLGVSSINGDSMGDSTLKDKELGVDTGSDKTSRLIDFNVEILLKLLKQIVARRSSTATRNKSIVNDSESKRNMSSHEKPLEEVKEIITLPEFDRRANKRQLENSEKVEIPTVVVEELRGYVACIANMYRKNHFHNFEHASHVVMSVIKHLNRIIAPTVELDVDEDKQFSRTAAAATLHDHTYGITSDPLTQFACAYSALIHDVDHPGVPNPQLIKEDPQMAAMYDERSVAEQNSLDIAWMLLMEPRFSNFRGMLCISSAELAHFRQLVVNSVMATDLGDKELKALRNNRWDKAFHPTEETEHSPEDDWARADVNRKATIVIEHLIQASDVSHTMQHWNIYRKWNQMLFEEMYEAYKAGRSEKNPAEFWYEGEIGFFDFYIIPLAKKLNDCGVFGISSDENLNYAQKNREEWKARGREVTAEMLDIITKRDGITEEVSEDFDL